MMISHMESKVHTDVRIRIRRHTNRLWGPTPRYIIIESDITSLGLWVI